MIDCFYFLLEIAFGVFFFVSGYLISDKKECPETNLLIGKNKSDFLLNYLTKLHKNS